MHKKPIAVIIGRPNAGKSTLFNRITHSKNAIVDDFPGVTRDRNYANVSYNGASFIIADTAGFTDQDRDKLNSDLKKQIYMAVKEAGIVIFMLDAKAGLSPFDKELSESIRKIDVPILYAVNKIDDPKQEYLICDFFSLGADNLYPISAQHGYGIRSFIDELIKRLPKTKEEQDKGNIINIAAVGKPNVGKSSLINKILGQERLLVSDTPGTTRDSIDTLCKVKGKYYRLIDTAGIRRKSKVDEKLEKFSVIKALESLSRCDIALIVIDAYQGITEQDITIAGYAYEHGCGCIFLLNKWDIVEKDNKTLMLYEKRVKEAAAFMTFAPVLTTSALKGIRVPKIFEIADKVYAQYSSRIETGPLNRAITKAVELNPPPLYRGRRLKFYYAAQVSIKPPTFVLFVSYPDKVHFSYKRYLTNQIREAAGLDITLIRVLLRERKRRN